MLDLLKQLQNTKQSEITKDIKQLKVSFYSEDEKVNFIKKNEAQCKCCGDKFVTDSNQVDISAFRIYYKYPKKSLTMALSDNGFVSCKSCYESIEDFFAFFRLFDDLNYDFLMKVYLIYISKNYQVDSVINNGLYDKMTYRTLGQDFWHH